MPRVAIYPGSFDPLTNGHLSLIQRGLDIFDVLIVALANNPDKAPLFSFQERMALIQGAVGVEPRVEVDSFDGLLTDYAKRRGIHTVLRGLRAVSDFEYELQMALMNRRLSPEVETVFMMPAEPYTYVSSRLVKEVVALGGSVHGLVPGVVEDRLREKKLARETLRA